MFLVYASQRDRGVSIFSVVKRRFRETRKWRFGMFIQCRQIQMNTFEPVRNPEAPTAAIPRHGKERGQEFEYPVIAVNKAGES